MSTALQGDVVLAIDTATTRIILALGTSAGEQLADSSWPAGYRHSETLLPALERLLADHRIDRSRIAAVVVGTGPGAFTGLRVGIATAKGLAHGLGRPVLGVATAGAVLAAAARAEGVPVERLVLLLPAGPSDRIVVRAGAAPALLPADDDPELGPGDLEVALDLDGRATADALARGESARRGMAAELLRGGAGRLAVGDTDDLARLVPEYVTLPRGVTAMTGEVTWSHDRR